MIFQFANCWFTILSTLRRAVACSSESSNWAEVMIFWGKAYPPKTSGKWISSNCHCKILQKQVQIIVCVYLSYLVIFMCSFLWDFLFLCLAYPIHLCINRKPPIFTPQIHSIPFNSHVFSGRISMKSPWNQDHIGAEGSSALSVACRSAHRYTVQLLLMEGASPFLAPRRRCVFRGNFRGSKMI